MGSFIFLCDFATEQECLDRKLFGTNPGESHRLHYSNVKVGDTLFLYNFETGQLRGPFIAMTPCTMNIEPQAWKKTRRSFPWQVRVDDRTVLTKPLNADQLRRYVSLSATKIGLLPPSELTDQETGEIVTALEKNQGV